MKQENNNAHSPNLSTKPLPNLRNWSMVEQFKRNLSHAATTQPSLFDTSQSQPATPRQINYLVKLYHQAGQKKFAHIKRELGITRKVPELTRQEASVLIKTLQRVAIGNRLSPA